MHELTRLLPSAEFVRITRLRRRRNFNNTHECLAHCGQHATGRNDDLSDTIFVPRREYDQLVSLTHENVALHVTDAYQLRFSEEYGTFNTQGLQTRQS